MELIVLGSGTGFISLKRGSPGFLLKNGKNVFLIDSGPGTLIRILKAGYELDDIDAIFYTHIHPDHVTDLVPFLFSSKYGNQRKKKLTVVGGPGFKKFFNGLSSVYRGWILPRLFPFKILEMGQSKFNFSGIRVLTTPTNHIPESVAYRFEEGNVSVVFSGDTDLSEDVSALAKGADLFVLECSFPDPRKVKGHLTPKDVVKMAHIANPQCLVLTHFYPPCERVNILRQVKQEYPGKVRLAKDGMRIKVVNRRKL